MPPKQRRRSSLSSMRKDELISILEGVFTCMVRHEHGLYELMTDWQDDLTNQVQRHMVNMGEPGDLVHGEMLDLAEDVLTQTRMRIRELHEPLLRKMIDLGLRP